MRRLTIAIDAGETTCAREPGAFCPFVGVKGFGTRPVCMLFRTADSERPLRDVDGWLQRLPECVAAEKDGESK